MDPSSEEFNHVDEQLPVVDNFIENENVQKNENEKKKNSQTSEFNIKKNIITTFKNYLFEKIEKYNIKLTNIPYNVYKQGTKNYLMFIFNLSIINFLTQPLPERKNPNKDKLTIDKIKDKKLKEILQMNFLKMFYKFYKEIKFKKKIGEDKLEEWKKIIEYKKEMKENEEYDYKKYGIYAYIKEKKGRKAQYEYNILNKKTKRDSNSNIKSDNQFENIIRKKTRYNILKI